MKQTILMLFLVGTFLGAKAQRVIAECTVNYTIVTDNETDKEVAASFKASTKTVYIKGNESRTDLVTPSFSQSFLYDKSSGEAVVLREFGENKFMNKLDNAKWRQQFARYLGAKLVVQPETKSIAGYTCKKALLTLIDGKTFQLYYTPDMVPSVREFEYQFKDIPGFVLEYEVEQGGKKITYTASKVNLSPVPASKFDIPESGYRILN